jgi:hypothetical protein
VGVLGELPFSSEFSAVNALPVNIDRVGEIFAFFLFPSGEVNTNGIAAFGEF